MKKTMGQLIVFVLIFVGFCMNLHATSYTIGASGQDFTSIQDAVDDASVVNGDTLLIVDAILTEVGIYINKDLIIIGVGTINGSVLQAAADSGTAVGNVMNIDGSTVKLVNLTIQHGVEDSGGGIYNEGILELYGCTVQKNVSTMSSPDGGGGIYNMNKLTVYETEFINNYTSGHGGAINISSSSGILIAEKCSFMNNFAEYGGGAIGMPYGDTLYINDCVFEGNTANGGQGGAILDGGGDDDEIIYIGNSEFRNNKCDNKNGGAIHLYMDSTYIENCIIENNSAYTGGGGIYLYEGSLMVDHCTIQGNVSGEGGGGIYIEDGYSIAFTNSTIKENNTESIGGGGMLLEYGDVLINNCSIEGNTTNDGGGGGLAIWYTDSAKITNTSIVNNSSAKRGGGINIYYESTVYVVNTNISDNNADKTGGGINNLGILYLDHVSLTNNISKAEGGGLSLFMNENNELSDATYIKNTVIANNFDSTLTFPDVQDDSLRLISAGYNLIGNLGNFEFANNTEGDIFGDTANTSTVNTGATRYTEIADPLLGDLTGEADELKYRKPIVCSSLIDAADVSSITGDPINEDMIGNVRPFGDGRDIGAIETDAGKGGSSTATVSNVTSTGFSVAYSPAVNGIGITQFSLNNGGVITSATTLNSGNSYGIVTNALTVDITYLLAIDVDCYTVTIAGDDIFVSSVNSINKNFDDKLILYPNPVSDILYITGLDNNNGVAKIMIFDLTGKMVQLNEEQIVSDIKINLSDLESGMYIIQINQGDSTFKDKLVVH